MQYADRALPIFRSVRGILLPKYGHAETVRGKSDSPVDVVTEVDEAVEAYLAQALERALPHISFVGEEGGGDRAAKQFWLCDPIDGTAHYVRGTPFCTSMLSLIDEGRVVFSAIYDFLNDKMYFAERGEGAYCEGTKLSVSDRPLHKAYLDIETKITNPENARIYHALRDRAVVFKTISAGFEFMMIASGKFEARIQLDPWGEDYDFAPGSLLIEEAGGKVANIGSKTFDYKNLNAIMANPVVFKELTEGPDALFPVTQ